MRLIPINWRRARGYRRIGFVLPHEGPNELDVRRFGAVRQCLADTPQADLVPPWLDHFEQLDGLGQWLEVYRPDVVIAGQPAVMPHLDNYAKRTRTHLPRCCLVPVKGYAHLSSNPQRIGYTALSFLHQQLVENQFGPQTDPFTVVIEPVWVDGPF